MICNIKISLFGVLIALSCGWTPIFAARPHVSVVSASHPEAEEVTRGEALIDTVSDMPTVSLDEITIEARGKRDLISSPENGRLTLRTSMLSEMPTLMGGGDMLSAMRSLEDIATASEMTASFSFRGLPTGSNLYMSNGTRLGNPMHLLGLYSAYVPGLYDYHTLDTYPDVRLPYNTAGAVLTADTDTAASPAWGASACIGLIESHADLKVPVSRAHPTVLRMAFRQSYLDKVFPGLLKTGTSTLGYSFSDGGISINSRLTDRDVLDVNLSVSHDNLLMHNDVAGDKEAKAGWTNVAAGSSWRRGHISAGAGFTWFKNNFESYEGSRMIRLPSVLTELTLFGDGKLKEGISLHLDGHLRHTSGQSNTALTDHDHAFVPGRCTGWELNPAASWERRFNAVSVDVGLRMSLYGSDYRGDRYFTAVPQPRVAIDWETWKGYHLTARYARLARFDRLLEESATGMPVNFFVNCSREVRYEDNHSVELALRGSIPGVWIDWHLSAYGIFMRNAAEYAGGLLNFNSAGYDPLADLHYGRGYSAGLAMGMTRQIGSLRGRLSYRWGRAIVRIPYFGDGYFPAVSDRTHDLTLGLTWEFIRNLTLSGNFTLASGTPYTKARYGYIIGENLICEYYPHNSSRLPAYKRLDLSLTYRLKHKRLTSEFNISVYNALASRNVLFIYNRYSLQEGLEVRESSFSSVIPSLSYTIHY